MKLASLALLCLVVLSGCESTWPTTWPAWYSDIAPVRVHEGDDARWASRDFDDSTWSRQHWATLGSSDRILWLRARIDRAQLSADEALHVSVSAIGAYEIYWNGTKIGASGTPGASPAQEMPGPMNSTVKVPASLVTSGENLLALRLSSFHLAGNVRNTLHMLHVGAPVDAMALRLRGYVPGIAASGALLLGACFFAALFVSDRRDRAAGLLALTAAAALGQFIAEALSAFVSYDYPFHLIRLWLVLGCAALYGLSLVAYVTERCSRAKQPAALLVTVVLMVIAVAFTPGYDNKTALAIIAAAVVALAIAAFTRPRRLLILFAPAALVFWFLLAPWQFLDEHIYVINACAIALLFLEQVRHLRVEQTARNDAEMRSARLELELIKRYIQPHFLLNTLTSLAEWVETNPKIGVRMIEALAAEFRLLARIGSERTIALADELALCRLHLDVMSLRHDVRLDLATYDIDTTRRLPPAILHTLLENALTHNRYPEGATFHLRETVQQNERRYELECPPGAQGEHAAGLATGTGLDYVRARLTEVFADRWQLADGRTAQGGWLTRIDVPA
jgi:MFS family permease